MKSLRKLTGVVWALCLILVLSACGVKAQPIAQEDGSILSYTEEEVPDGYYIRKHDGKFYPLLKEGLNNSPPMYLWYQDLDHLVPTMESDEQLVIVQSAPGISREFNFTKLQERGWTIGALFNIQYQTIDDVNYPEFALSETVSSGSRAASDIATMDGSPDKIQIQDVNGQEVVPEMFNPRGIMMGLTKDATYRFNYYHGTRYHHIDMIADTHVYVETDQLSSEGYERVRNIYFVVNLPTTIDAGYYVIDGAGVFIYQGN